MKKIAFLVCLLLCIIMYSCKKNAGSVRVAYNSDYAKSDVIPAGDLRVFTGKGEITNASIVERFTNNDSNIYYNTAIYIKTVRGYMDTVRFTDAERAVVGQPPLQINCQFSGNPGKIILTRTDTTSGVSIYEVLRKSYPYIMGEIKSEVYSEYLLSSTGGFYLFGYRAKEKFVYTSSNDQLAAPLLQFTVHRNQDIQNYYINNFLQRDFFKSFLIGDTVTFRDYRILYTKR